MSSYHIEMNPSEASNRDVDVIQELVKQMAEGQSLSGLLWGGEGGEKGRRGEGGL